MSACVFCSIVRGDAPAHPVCEDEFALAFMDRFPLAPGHVLVIPKQHASNIFEIDPESLAAVSRTTQQLAHGIRKAFDPDGVMVMQLNGEAAGQTVFHYHAHLIPRDRGSSLTLQPRVEAQDHALAAWAGQLQAALG